MSVFLRIRSTLFVRRLFSTRSQTLQARLHLYSCRPAQNKQPSNSLSQATSCHCLPLRKFYSTSTDGRKETMSFQIEKGGQELNLSWKDSHNDVSVYAVWLRHNCQCPECLAENGQCLVVPQLLDPSITVDSADISGNLLNLSWSSGHRGYIDIDWLKKNTNVDTISNSTLPVASTVPRLSAVGMETDVEKQWKWLYYLNEYGLCVLTDFGTEKNSVTNLAKLMYNVQPTVYGEVFDVITDERPANLAYSTSRLLLHSDLTMYESFPGLQLLHCLRFDSCVEGGASVILDPLPVVEEMKAKYPEHFDSLVRIPATFHRVHYGRKEPVDMTYYAPHIVLDKNGKVTTVRWNASIMGPSLAPKDDMLSYYAAYKCFAEMLERSNLKLKFRLQPGEVLTFNNRRVMHSREEFELNGGVRHLQGTYVNIDEFKSKFQVLCNKLGKQDHPVRRVFNGSAMNIN